MGGVECPDRMPTTPPRTVAITGATGFIGRALAGVHVAFGDEVRVLSRRRFDPSRAVPGTTWCQGDICHPLSPDLFDGVHTVYHLAAELHDPARMQAVHVDGTANLLAAAAGRVQRWVQLSSVGVYGPPAAPIVNEETVPAPANEYERTKYAADRRVEDACRSAGLEYAILRPSNVIGAAMQNGSVFALINAVRRGRFFYIGPRGAIATYVHVDDVVRALVACQAAPSGRVYNLSSDCTWEALIGRIASLTGVRPPRLRLPAWPLRLGIRTLEGRVRLSATWALPSPGHCPTRSKTFWARDLEPASHRACGRIAIARRGAPLPPLIFIGKATINAPRAGSCSSEVRFSNAGIFFAYSVRCDSKSVDCP